MAQPGHLDWYGGWEPMTEHVRCEVTKNIVGTDTEMVGFPCQCGNCRMVREARRLTEPKRCICQDQHRRGYCTEPTCPNCIDV